jgi:hypothetical protein
VAKRKKKTIVVNRVWSNARFLLLSRRLCGQINPLARLGRFPGRVQNFHHQQIHFERRQAGGLDFATHHRRLGTAQSFRLLFQEGNVLALHFQRNRFHVAKIFLLWQQVNTGPSFGLGASGHCS